ncbi:hypothetical protein FOMPIDRAFT_1045123 [Fomitopsis schrenkii]|uniref:CHAT domain-containing protein n=1 Tax=Fomitopsis schrenkii TaxID=2126942 RepID=S8ENX2_FOMSC|nr:hypothetical protein FOMPIDRAFT_1045123 [Fomitopsis schrenkii]
MPQAAYLGLSPKQRLQSITDAEPAAIMAASHALALHDIPTAMELLEKGRAVFWQQATRLRTRLVSSTIPLKNEINQLLHSLDNQPILLDPQDRKSVEQEEAKRWRQTQRLEKLLKEFRKQFEAEAKEHSLFPPEYPSLIQAAKKGPIVVLLSTPVFSGAVIIRQGGASDLVHLPEANPNWLGGWVQSWNNYVESARALPRDARAAYLVGLRNISHSQHELLEELWDKVALPVIQALGLAKLSDAAILHLASHGIQMQGDPLQSRFLMADRMLTMEELMKLSLPNAFLAILSACQTATGDKRQADQAVHLAATMQFLGFKSVIATMWSMADSVGVDIAKTIYQHLYKDPSKPLDPDLVAIALDEAVKKLHTSSKDISPSTWAPFIHIGI